MAESQVAKPAAVFPTLVRCVSIEGISATDSFR